MVFGSGEVSPGSWGSQGVCYGIIRCMVVFRCGSSSEVRSFLLLCCCVEQLLQVPEVEWSGYGRSLARLACHDFLALGILGRDGELKYLKFPAFLATRPNVVSHVDCQ